MALTYIRPDADDTDGTWTNESGSATLFSSIDETVADDNDYIKSAHVPDHDICKIRLSDPAVLTMRPATVHYRFKKRGEASTQINLDVSLLQGSTEIAKWSESDIGTSYVDGSQALTIPQFNSITDFTNLYLQFDAFSTWWKAGSSIDLDFEDGLYYDSGAGGAGQAVTSYLSCSRSTVGYAKNSGGTWVSFAIDTLRITDLGVLVENSRTNNLLNSDAPATQTTASLATGDYTLWVEGSGSALASAGSASITGAASVTAGNPDTFTVTVAGTVTVTVTGSLTKFQLEEGTFPTSFILTTGTAFTRAADVVNVTGNLDTVIKGSAWSAVADAIIIPGRTTGETPGIIGSTGGTNYIFYSVTGYSIVRTYNGSAEIGATLGSSLTFFNGAKAGLGLNSSGRSIVGAGGTVTTDTDAMPTVTGTIGFMRLPQTGDYWWGYCRRFTVWNSRIADATLQTLTAP